jgi:hypothetical protein
MAQCVLQGSVVGSTERALGAAHAVRRDWARPPWAAPARTRLGVVCRTADHRLTQ